MIWDRQKSFCEELASGPVPERGKILVTGGTGYIGGMLMPELIERGYEVRAMVRAASPEHVERWPSAEVTVADALDPASLRQALRGIHTAYYLIHSLLLGPKDFEQVDIQSATNFRDAAEAEGVKRIIYLGGLVDVNSKLSAHLRSRTEVANVLAAGSVPTTVLRAAVIIGSGSASYEMIKHLVLRLPILLIPHWGGTRCQPIAAGDVIRYLVGVLEADAARGRSFDIGGADVLTYEEMMRVLARILGRRRMFMHVPFSNITVYAYVGSFLTPVPTPITLCLMEGVRNDVVCHDEDIRGLVPFAPKTYKEALLSAMSIEEQDAVHTRWSDAYPPAHELAVRLRDLEQPATFSSTYSLVTQRDASALFHCICRIGGKEGWFQGNWMWRLRGLLDRVLAGVGTLRGRRSASSLRVNDVIDFWRVEELQKDRKLLLRAEMKLPGWAWLEFRIHPMDGCNRMSVTAYHETRTLFGKLYWYTFLPFHFYILNGLLLQIERRSCYADERP